MLFGFYWMANPANDVFREIGAFGLSLVAGMMIAVGIMSFEVTGTDVFALCTLATATATLMTAVPRLVYQSFLKGFPIALLFRLSAYVAIVFTLESFYDETPTAWLLIAAQSTVMPGFYAFYFCHRKFPHIFLVWMMVPVYAFLNNLAFATVVFQATGLSDFSWKQLLFPFSGNVPVVATLTGLLVFYSVLAAYWSLVRVRQSQLGDAPANASLVEQDEPLP